MKRQGLELPPKLAVGDGAMGFWAALRKVYPATGEQRCWLHKTVNVLNKLPKSMQGKAKKALHDIYLAESRQTAEKALDRFQKLIRKEVSQSGRVPGERPQGAAGFLRLSGRALGTLADDEPD